MSENKHQRRDDRRAGVHLEWDDAGLPPTWRDRLGKPADFPLHAATEVERAMEAEIADLRAHADPAGAGLLRVGGQMANVMYNLAQQAGRPLAARDCEVMDQLRKDWDAARGYAVPATNEEKEK